ncbi:MAG: hypothetical protein JNM58_14200 [Xanthomonadaceae bacterium]|nr:hypothetical protein [Xanthomonadaceae bacterium]
MSPLHGRGLALVALLLASIVPCAGISADTPAPPQDWAWLAADGGTYWYVPQAGLPAYRWRTSDPAGAQQVSDQTVWHIERVENGYVFGPVVAQLNDEKPQCQYLIGSITPEGQVYLTFNSTGGNGTPTLTTGVGAVVADLGGPAFQMQMATGSDTLQVTHWARMTQCREGEPCWTDLPGLQGTSVREFLGNCGTD